MATTSRPQGLKAAYHPSGVIRPSRYTIASAYGTALFKNTPVGILADGTIGVGTAAGPLIGAFIGCEFTDSEGRRRVNNRWTASTVATDIVAYVIDDPTVVYEIQANGSITVADIGSQAEFANVGAGSTVTGLSSAALAQSTLTNSGNAPLRVLNIAPGPDNAAGDAFTIVQVEISEHQRRADRAAF